MTAHSARYRLPAAIFLALALALALLGASACDDGPVAVTGSGIEGQVYIGPVCPVNCADRPFQASISVLNLRRSRVARFTTDAEGRFRQGLAPGSYIVHPEPPGRGPLPRAADQSVSVSAGVYTPVTITYDTGIR